MTGHQKAASRFEDAKRRRAKPSSPRIGRFVYGMGVPGALYPPFQKALRPRNAGEMLTRVQLGQVDELERPARFDPGVCRGPGRLRMDGRSLCDLAHVGVLAGFV